MTATEVQEVLGTIPAPSFEVVRWVVDTGTDATGHDAVWVWAVVDGPLPPAGEIMRLEDTVQEALRVRSSSTTPWVYLRPRLVTEN
ncbi:MAG: hypothetical protein FJX72_09840 [Armatimonadetes bacterium]|nr:hypothetical protein [Armatimonadota bacterium]